MDCKSCGEIRKQAEDNHGSKYYTEMIVAALERTIKRMLMAIMALAALSLVLAFLLYNNNRMWLEYISQYDFESYAVDLTTEGGGNANYIGNDGDIINGEGFGTQEDAD